MQQIETDEEKNVRMQSILSNCWWCFSIDLATWGIVQLFCAWVTFENGGYYLFALSDRLTHI